MDKHTYWWGLIAFFILLNSCSLFNSREFEIFPIQEHDLQKIKSNNPEIAAIQRTYGKAEVQFDLTSIKETDRYNIVEYLNTFPIRKPDDPNYRIGGYDVLAIKVYGEPDLTFESLSVNRNGYISFPMIGRIQVSGLTTSQIEDQIEDLLAEGDYILDAHVNIEVNEYNNQQYTILGTVKDPGNYPISSPVRLLQALSLAGGIDYKQSGKDAFLIRSQSLPNDQSKQIVIVIDIKNLLKNGDQKANLLIQDSDIVYIPKAENYYIIGEVNKPGAYPYLADHVSIIEAISNAGGFTSLAARNNTRIIREMDQKSTIMIVHVDSITKDGRNTNNVNVLPGDIIIVPERLF